MTVFFCCPAFADISEIIYDDCFFMKVSGEKTGFVCSIQRKKTENKIKYIITDRHFEQTVKRLNKTIKIIQDIHYVEEKESGKPVSFSIKSIDSGEIAKIVGKFKSFREVEVDFDINGIKSSENIKFKEKILFPYAIDGLYKYSRTKTIKYATVEPGIDLRVIKIKTKKKSPESLKSDGLNRKYNKYEVSMNILPGIKCFEWRDLTGKIVKEFNPLFKIEIVKAKKKDVLNASYDGSYDLFSESLILVNKPLPDPDKIERIIYKITGFDIPVTELFLQNDRQKITQLKDNEIYLKIDGEKQEMKNYPYPVATKGFEEYLKTGPFIMPDSNKISGIAKMLVSGETDAYVIAKKTENLVYKHITKKDYSLNFANAVRVLETKKGDCTEHSVLLASLLRAEGIPAKIVIGLIYIDNPKPAFAYHMWVKAYIGEWLNLDAALPYKSFVPTHTAMFESPLNNISDRGDILINVLKSFSNIKIEVLNADLPIISKTDSGHLKINFGNSTDNNFLTIENIKDESKKEKMNYPGIKNISLNEHHEKDYIRSAFYNFIKGNIQQSFDDFILCYNSVSPGDDFAYMKLGLKLTGTGFFNLASKTFDNVKDRNIWALQISNIKSLYFPEKEYSHEDEILTAEALSKITYRNLPDEGINLINKHKGISENNDYARYLLARAYLAKNDIKSARQETAKAIEINPENLTYRMEKAKIHIKENNYKAAERELELITGIIKKENIIDPVFLQEFNEQSYWLKFKLERTNPLKSKFYKAKYYEAKKEYGEALDVLNDILSYENADKAPCFETKGTILLKKGNIIEAKHNFLKTLEIDENNFSALAGLGEICFLNTEYGESLENYGNALLLEPENSNIKLKIAEIYENSGREEEAYNYYRAVLLDSSLNSEANYKLGLMYLKTGDFEESKKRFTKALSAKPMYSLIWLNLAGLEISRGNYSEAKKYLKSAAAVDDKNPYYYYYTGMIYKERGDFEKAKENFDKASELKPDFDEINRALERL